MIRNKIASGLLVWVPIVVTIFTINFLLNLFDQVWILVPTNYRPEAYLGFSVPGLSIVIIFLLIYITGHLVSNFLGKRLVQVWENTLDKIPGVRSFYRGIKQMTEALFVTGNKNFRNVFLVEYPRKGLWTIAFETSELQGEAHYLIDQKHPVKQITVSLFVPTTPNPTSGYFIITDKADLIALDMKVDDALKMIISGGVFVPEYLPKQLLPKKVQEEIENPNQTASEK